MALQSQASGRHLAQRLGYMIVKKLLILFMLSTPVVALAQDRRYASLTSADEAFLANPKETPSVIRWVVVPDPDAECRGLQGDIYRSNRNGNIRGCAKWTNKACTITGVETSHAILGHELRHCFEGKFHD